MLILYLVTLKTSFLNIVCFALEVVSKTILIFFPTTEVMSAKAIMLAVHIFYILIIYLKKLLYSSNAERFLSRIDVDFIKFFL